MTHQFAIEHILADAHVTEIMISGHQHIVIEKHGKLQDVPSPYRDAAHLLADIRAIFEPLGLSPDESHPLLDGRLQDGSRVNLVMPPIALDGPALTIRKFNFRQPTLDDLVNKYHSLTPEIVDFLRACILGRLNIAICGGTGSGKTTLANAILDMIPDDERLVITENANGLLVRQPRAVRLEARPANLEGKGAVTVRDLVRNAMKMRPDRIIVGEVEDGEAFDLLQAMNTGYDGSFFTMHAINPRDALPRLEILMAGGSPTTPVLGLRDMIAKGLNLIVQINRLPSGARRVVNVTEITGMTGDTITLQDIFVWEQTSYIDGKETGRFRATGIIPTFVKRFHEMGIDIPVTMFTPR
ncbi:MAG: CpaF family protein [Chloroflexi bacterium]|nr:CpaF family protein [Chloroflexota bacterium]